MPILLSSKYFKFQSLAKMAVAVGFIFFLSFTFGYAQVYKLIAPIGGVEDVARGGVGITQYFSNIYTLSFGIAAILAVLMLVVGGVQYTLTFASESQKSSAKETIRAALFGLAIVLVAWLILNTINPDLVGGTLNLECVEKKGAYAPNC